MEKSLENIVKAFLDRFLEIIGIPISILLVIIGVYGNILDYNLLNNTQVENNLLQFFITEKKLASEKEALVQLPIPNDPLLEKTYNSHHLIIIDITGSGKNKKLDFQCKRFIDSVFVGRNINMDRTVKNALTYEFLKKYSQPTNQYSKLLVVLYKGDNTFSPVSGAWLSSEDSGTRQFLLESMIAKIKDYESDSTKDTDITEIVNFANKNTKDKERAIITIISDFQHEKENLQISDLRKLISSGLKKINAVYIPAGDLHHSTKSLDIIKSLKNLENSSIDVFNSDIMEKLFDHNFSKNTLEFVTHFVNESSKLPTVGSQIEFYYPRKDSLDRNVINRNFILKKEEVKNWRISSYSGNLPHIEMTVEKKASFTLSNEWEEWYDGNIKINILNDNYATNSNNLYLEIQNQNNDIIRYPVIIRKYIPKIICKISIWVIWFLIISVLMLMLAKIIQTSNDARNAKTIEIGRVLYSLITTAVIYIVTYKVITVFFNEPLYWIAVSLLCIINLFLFFLLAKALRRVRNQRA